MFQGNILYSSGNQRWWVGLSNGRPSEYGQALPPGTIYASHKQQFTIDRKGAGLAATWEIDKLEQSYDTAMQGMLIDNEKMRTQFGDYNTGPGTIVLSDDGKTLFFDACQGDTSNRQCRMFGINVGPGEWTVSDLNFPCGQGAMMAPDGQRALGAAQHPLTVGGTDVPALLFSKGAAPHPVAASAPRAVAWLPDGRFVWSSTSLGSGNVANANLIVSDRTGRILRVLVKGVEIDNVAVSPDGRQVIYTTMQNPALWLMNLDGTAQRKVTDLPAGVHDIMWTTGA